MTNFKSYIINNVLKQNKTKVKAVQDIKKSWKRQAFLKQRSLKLK